MIYRALSLVLLLVYTVTCQAANLSVKVDRQQINFGETISLSIIADVHTGERPDWQVLAKDFRILGTSASTNVEIINGHTKTQTEWLATLLPKYTGTITIPAIKVGDSKTDPVELKVLKEVQKIQPGELPEAFLEVSVEPQEAFVKQQLVYSIKLYHRQQIVNPALEPPSSDDIKLEPVQPDKNYIKMRGEKQYQVFERNYVIFPQKNGDIKIAPPYFSGILMRSGVSRPMMSPFYNNDLAKPLHLQAKSITINVKPKPASFKGKWWLPTESLTLSQTWSDDTNHWQVGEPMTRTITLTALGLAADQLPQLKFGNTPDLKVYPDKPQLKTELKNGKIESSIEIKVAMVPTKSGPLNIPALSVAWWDVKSNQQRQTSLPQQTITIVAAPVLVPDQVKPKTATPPVTANEPSVVIGGTWFWPLVTGALLLIWFITLIAWWQRGRWFCWSSFDCCWSALLFC